MISALRKLVLQRGHAKRCNLTSSPLQFLWKRFGQDLATNGFVFPQCRRLHRHVQFIDACGQHVRQTMSWNAAFFVFFPQDFKFLFGVVFDNFSDFLDVICCVERGEEEEESTPATTKTTTKNTEKKKEVRHRSTHTHGVPTACAYLCKIEGRPRANSWVLACAHRILRRSRTRPPRLPWRRT